ncbi:MAG TPA: GNAT family N-acetyltransferase [Pyrinomonadaceae bacterium]|nr:GNAT family N-acetyltransferase [Pyrinomonadaceae bacterium]
MQVEDLTIRRAEPDDSSALYEMFKSPTLYANTLQLPYPSREMWRQRLAEPGDGRHNLVALAEGRVVGMFSLHAFTRPRRQHAGAIGMSVHDGWHGKGVGSALMRAGLDLADNWLNLTRLELEVYTDNEPAVRLYERFGFEREGLLRRHAYRDGRFVDSYVMARLRDVNSGPDSRS